MIVEPQSVVQSSTVLENWIAEITTELSCDEGYAYRLLRSVLQALRDWLPPQESAELSARLPTLVRRMYLEEWRPDRTRLDHISGRDKYAFATAVCSIMGPQGELQSASKKDRAITAVLKVMGRHLFQDKVDQEQISLKAILRKLSPGL